MSARLRGMIAAYACGTGVSWNIANVGPMAEAVSQHYGIALASVGLFTAVLFGAELASMTAIGWATQRYGPRFLGLLALGLCTIGNLLTLATSSIEIALLLRFVVGFGVGLGFVGGLTYVQQLGGDTLNQGVYGGLSLAMGGLAVGVVPLFASSMGWQAPFVTAAVVGVVAMFVVALGPGAGITNGSGQGGGFVWVLRDPRLLRFAIVHSASFSLGIVLSNWVVTLLDRRGGYELKLAGMVGALILIAGIVARPGGGLYTHMRPEHSRRVIQVGLLLGAVGTLLLGIAPEPALAIPGAILVGLAAGLPFGPAMSGLGRTFHANPGAAFGAVNFWAEIVIVIGTPLVGFTFSLPGTGLLGFAGASVFCLFAAFMAPAQHLLGGTVDAPAQLSAGSVTLPKG